MIHRDLLVTEIYRFGHVVGDIGGQIGMTKKGPAAKVHGANIPVHLWVVLPCQHGAGKPDLFHFAQNFVVNWQESHTCVERGRAPAFHAFVEDGVGPFKADCVHAFRAAGARSFHDFTAPAFDVGEANAVSSENLFNRVERCLQLPFAASRDAQWILLLFDLSEGLNAAVLAHSEDQPVPGWKHADGAERDFFLVKADSEISHSRQSYRIAETEVIFLLVHQDCRPRAAELRIPPAHGDVQL